MSRAIADPLYDRLLRAYPPDQAYTPSDWADAPMPAPLRHFLNHRLRHQKKQEFQRIQNAHGGWVRTQHPVVRRAQQTYLDAIEPYLHIPTGQWQVVLQQATRHVTAYLVRPVPTLLAFFFGDSDAPCPASRARWRMQYFGPYGYLREAIDAYIDRQDQAPLHREAVRTFLYRVEVGMTRNNTPEQWIQLLSPLFSFARVATDRAALPASLLETFFEQKSATDWVERIQADAERGVRELTPRDLRDLAWSPQDAPGDAPNASPEPSALSLEEIPDPAPESAPPSDASSDPYGSEPYEDATREASAKEAPNAESASRETAPPDPVADALDAQDDAQDDTQDDAQDGAPPPPADTPAPADPDDAFDDVSEEVFTSPDADAPANAAPSSQPITPLDPVSDEDLHPDEAPPEPPEATESDTTGSDTPDTEDEAAADPEPDRDDTDDSVWDRPLESDEDVETSFEDDLDRAPSSSWPPPEYAQNWPGMGSSDSGFALDDVDEEPEASPESGETDEPFGWERSDEDPDDNEYDWSRPESWDDEDKDTDEDAYDWRASGETDNDAEPSAEPPAAPGEPSPSSAPPPNTSTASESAGKASANGPAEENEASDDSTPLWQRFQRSEPSSDEPADPPEAEEPSAPSNGDDNTPLWARFQSKDDADASRPQAARPSAPSDASSVPDDLDDLEQRVFGNSDASQRSLYLRQLFDGSVADYYEVLQTIESADTWREASQVIARDVFRAHQVNIYSDAAVQFTDAVEASF